MARFEGLTDEQWRFFEPQFTRAYEPGIRGPGMPPTNFRTVLNTILWVLFNGAKWNSVPIGPQWAPRSTSHRWLGIWTTDGTWERLGKLILGVADNLGLVDLSVGSVDGMFVPGKGGGDDVDYGYKGKGCTLHHLCDNNGRTLALETTAANVDERRVLEALLERFEIQNGKRGRPKKRVKALQADKGYQDKELQKRLRKRGITPRISQKRTTVRKRGRPCAKPIDRFKIERSHAWLQKRFRRLDIKWERRRKYWIGFVLLGIIFSWVPLILQVLNS